MFIGLITSGSLLFQITRVRVCLFLFFFFSENEPIGPLSPTHTVDLSTHYQPSSQTSHSAHSPVVGCWPPRRRHGPPSCWAKSPSPWASPSQASHSHQLAGSDCADTPSLCTTSRHRATSQSTVGHGETGQRTLKTNKVMAQEAFTPFFFSFFLL